MFSSGKNDAFKCLVYLHRYNEDTLARINSKYFLNESARLNAEVADTATQLEVADGREKIKLDKAYKALAAKQKEMLDYALEHSRYKVGENVAIAQRYIDLAGNDEFYRLCGIHGMPLESIKHEKGCKNKMFVKACLMPHHIHITNVRIEKLQDISEEDVIREGFDWCCCNLNMCNAASQWEYHLEYFDNLGRSRDIGSVHAKEAYSFLIDHISGVGTWENNPFVFVYDFDLL